jgi:RNA polymerase sigma factor (TIGR02999 family)
MTPTSHEITELLLAWSEGDKQALDRLVPLVYDELRRLAHNYMRKERAGQTLQTTALIHEAYLRLIEAERVQWRNRAHFFGIAARLMRQILVARARERGCQKRGGGEERVSLDEAMVIDERLDEDLVALDEALGELSQFDARMAQVVEMRFFGGLTEEEIAAALDVSTKTVRRDWRLARSWLRRKLSWEQTDEA